MQGLLETIEEQRNTKTQTRRVTVAALEDILYQPIPVLDRGFLRVIDYMGNDTAIVQAARISYGTGAKTPQRDKALLFYLMRHGHTTPFEACEIKLHVKLPIFVARQWVRHRTANINEFSARYSIVEDDFYQPQVKDLQNATDLRHATTLEPKQANSMVQTLQEETQRTYALYKELLEAQLNREQARMVLPTNVYTQWYWKIDLHNLFHFLEVRTASNAQYEIRAYAEKMLEIVKRWVPVAYEAFVEYRRQGVCLSAQAVEVIRRVLAGEVVCEENSQLNKREWRDLQRIFNLG